MFGFNKSIESLVQRVMASLERFDNVLGEAQLLIRNVDGLVREVRDMLGSVRSLSPKG